MDNAAMIIRPAQHGDFTAIAAITNHYIETTAIHFSESPVSADELRDAWLETRDRHPFLVAEIAADATSRIADGAPAEPPPRRLIGYAKAGPWRTRSAYRFTAESGIYVSHDAHRRGVGTTLYAALIDACRRAGFHTLVGGVTMPNDASVRLHERLGFIKVGVFSEVGFKFGRWHGVGFWQLTLCPSGERSAPLEAPED